MGFYDHTLARPDGSELNLRDLEGKVALVVNTATGCGFTPQYDELVAIYSRHHEAGLEILDIPCNQFKEQAPGTDAEIAEFCRLNFGTQWEHMAKADVRGPSKIALYDFLISACPFTGLEAWQASPRWEVFQSMWAQIDPAYVEDDEIKWNFTKFLVSREGDVVARFEPVAELSEVEAAIEELLAR